MTGPFSHGVVARAAQSGALEIVLHDLRRLDVHDLHRTVDDRPFGGGEGMLLKPEPIFDAVETRRGLRAVKGSRVTSFRRRDAGSPSRQRANSLANGNCW